MTRTYIDVKWKASEKLWTVRLRSTSGGILAYVEQKANAVKRGRAEARAIAAAGGKAELVIFRMDNTIGKGRSSRSSYPRRSDPRRRRG